MAYDHDVLRRFNESGVRVLHFSTTLTHSYCTYIPILPLPLYSTLLNGSTFLLKQSLNDF